MGTGRAVGFLDGDARARIWKETHVPLLYDWISSRKLVWPHAAVQWGHHVRSEFLRGRSPSASSDAVPTYTTRALYLAERTGDSADPNTLLCFDARVTLEHTASTDNVAKPWCDEAVTNSRNDGLSAPEFWLRKRLIHPGEVNKIRTVLPGVVVTHTDRPELFVWDFGQQENRRKDESKHKPSTPTCTLVGHTKNAEYALSTASPAPLQPKEASADVWVASGGSDCQVLVWRLKDYETMGNRIQSWTSFRADVSGGNGSRGHRATVEDVSFCGTDRNIIASVGRDAGLLLWDVRQPASATSAVLTAHRGDINTCDYAGPTLHMIVTGGSDQVIRVWDHRKLVNSSGVGVPVGEFREHTGQINIVMWNKFVPHVFASGGDDGEVLIWDMTLQEQRQGAATTTAPDALLFRHVGHSLQREKAVVVDLEWIPDESDPWCIASISEMVGDCGGSVLQMWRMSSMIYTPQDTVAHELRMLQTK